MFNHSTPNNSTERLFFALWPYNNIRQAINQLNQPIIENISGKIIPSENWHITLAFLGNVDSSTKQCMQQAATAVQSSSFSFSLDKLGYWLKPRIFWIGASHIPETLRDLINNLNLNLQDCGYCPENRPFHAHLTLMRKATPTKKLPVITPITWTVTDFCLVRSTLKSSGAYYEVIARWPL